MPRVARGLADGYVYHVLNRGNGRQRIFHKDGDYQAFLDLLAEAKERNPIKLYAYCLMPNHFHLLVRPEQGAELSRYMQWFMTSHVRRYHRHYGTSGHVWQGRFKSFIVQEDEHLLTVARYIEGNPVQAGLVTQAKDWPWSSHGETGGGQAQRLTDELPVGIPGNWSEWVEAPLSEKERGRIRQSLERRAPFGSADWQQQICLLMGLGSTIRPLGRPRKEAEK